jgi:hypothetical protein
MSSPKCSTMPEILGSVMHSNLPDDDIEAVIRFTNAYADLIEASNSTLTVLTGGTMKREDAGEPWATELFDIHTAALAKARGQS